MSTSDLATYEIDQCEGQTHDCSATFTWYEGLVKTSCVGTSTRAVSVEVVYRELTCNPEWVPCCTKLVWYSHHADRGHHDIGVAPCADDGDRASDGVASVALLV